MPVRQAWVDPNTGGTFPISLVVGRVDGIDPNGQTLTISYQRYASNFCYSQGFKPLVTVATQIAGATYASWFGPTVLNAQAAMQSAVLGAAASYIAAAPEFSGAIFF